jgi:hypothetical protein
LDVGVAPANTGRNARIAERTDRIAERAAAEARDRLRAGDAVGARAAWDRCTAARRAARMLRTGPGGVREVLEAA